MRYVLCLLLATAATAHAQIPTIGPHLARTEGVDSSSGIAYTRIYLAADTPANTATPHTPSPTFDLSQPTLTAQCTMRPDGRHFLEIFVNFGGVTDTTFYPPFKPTDTDLFPPRTPKAIYTMEFLGYTKVKPFKRQWEHVLLPYGQLRYNSPGMGSPNLEEFSFYLQYLRALPTLRLSGEGHVVSFSTQPLLERLHSEPLCTASGL